MTLVQDSLSSHTLTDHPGSICVAVADEVTYSKTTVLTWVGCGGDLVQRDEPLSPAVVLISKGLVFVPV